MPSIQDKLNALSNKISTKYGLARYREKYVTTLNQAARSKSLSPSEIAQYRSYYNARIKGENTAGLLRLAKAPDSQVVGNAKELAIKELERQKMITVEKQPITSVSSSDGNVYRGREVGERFIGVRTVSKEEQRVRDTRVTTAKKGFYSIFDGITPPKSNGRIIAEQTATRSGLGIYTSSPLTQELKFSKQETGIETPKETGIKGFFKNVESQAERTRYEYKLAGSLGVAAAVDFTGGFIKGVSTPILYPVETTKGVLKLAFFPLYPKSTKETFSNIGKEATTRPFRFAGNVAGSYVLFKGVEKVGGVGKSVYTRAKSEYLFKFKPADKGIYSKFDYKVGGGSYNLGSGQRNLYGRNIGKTPSPAGNINKVGFGIEKDTLKGATNTILPSGQTKLAQNQIVAFNKVSGTFSEVKITPNKDVYVYNPSIKKFTELSPDYQLITRNPKYSFNIVGAENIYKPTIVKFDVSKQSSLGGFGFGDFNKAFKKSSPIYSTTATETTITKISSQPIRVFSKTNSVSTFRPQLSSGVLETSQYTYPSYSVIETTTAKTPIINMKSSALGLGVTSSISNIGNFNIKTSKSGLGLKSSTFNIQGSNFISGSKETYKTISTNKQNFIQIKEVGNIQLPRVRQQYKQAQAQEQAQIPITEQKQSLIPKTTTRTDTQNYFRTSTSFSPRVTKFPISFNFISKKSNSFPSLKGFSIATKQPKAYRPSVRAAFLGIKGESFGVSSGLGERPIKKKKRFF